MINQTNQRRERDEEIRLQNAEELMYGNQDNDNLLAFDAKARFKYLVYHESLDQTPDGQIYSLKATRRYSFFTPLQWDTLLRDKYFERHKKIYKVLHDPLQQAKMEGVTLKGYYEHKTGASVKDKLKNVKKATDFVKANETIQAEETEKVRRNRKEVVNG
jgi:hypothetical protein